MSTVIVLIRGINVGGNRLVPMAELRAMLESEGYPGPRTFLQSGNALIRTSKASNEALESELELQFAVHFGFTTDIVCRSLEAWDEVIERCPMKDLAADNPSRFHVHFLKHPAESEKLRAWEEAAPGAETIRGFEKELYINYPEGMGQSKLKVPFLTTARNWNTVLKLADLAKAVESDRRAG